MIEVKSSNIRAIGHHPLEQSMDVEFPNGTKYSYGNVSEEIFQHILTAESVGKAFNNLVKTKPVEHPYTRLA